MKLNCEFFYGYEADQFKFYRVPQILVTDKRFKNVSYGAKLLYGVLLDRMGLSIMNKWCDDKNRAFIIYSIYKIIERESAAPSIAQATKLRKTAEAGELDSAMLEYIMTSTKPESIKLVIYEDKLRRYFPKNYTKEQIEDTVMKLIQKWHKNREKENER